MNAKQWAEIRTHLRLAHDVHRDDQPDTEYEVFRLHRRLHEQMLAETGTPLHDPTY